MYKMRKLITLMMAYLISIPVFAKQEIHWNGDWNTKGKSMTFEIPIIGYVEEITGELSLEFRKDLGDVEVTVTDTFGKTVYQETVSTGNTPTWTVILDESVQNGSVSITDGINWIHGNLTY